MFDKIKRIPNWEQYYITSGGLLFREGGYKNRINGLGSQDGAGYIRTTLRDKNRKRDVRLHTLVWEAFNGEVPEGYVIDHINNIKNDNRLENLQLLGNGENLSKGTLDLYYVEKKKRWRTRIQINHKRKQKFFKTKEEAIEQRRKWKEELGWIL